MQFKLIDTTKKELSYTNHTRVIKILCYDKDISFVKNCIILNLYTAFKQLYGGFEYNILTTKEINYRVQRDLSYIRNTKDITVNKFLKKDTITLREINIILARVSRRIVF